jgi:hypothetical protein
VRMARQPEDFRLALHTKVRVVGVVGLRCR